MAVFADLAGAIDVLVRWWHRRTCSLCRRGRTPHYTFHHRDAAGGIYLRRWR